MPFAPQQSSRPLLPSEIQTLRIQRVMPVVLLAGIMAMLGMIVLFFLVIAWERIPATKWFAGGVALLYVVLIVAAIRHMRAARADLVDGTARIGTGRATGKRTSGRRSTWYYTTFDSLGELEVTREQYQAIAIDSAYTVSYSPRVSRAWTVELV